MLSLRSFAKGDKLAYYMVNAKVVMGSTFSLFCAIGVEQAIDTPVQTLRRSFGAPLSCTLSMIRKTSFLVKYCPLAFIVLHEKQCSNVPSVF